MKEKSSLPLLLILSLLLAVPAFAATVPVGSGSYTNTLPAGKPIPPTTQYKTSAITAPVPTNDWWTSLVASQYSTRMFAFPLCFRCENVSLLIGYPQTVEAADHITSNEKFVQQLKVQGVYGSGTTLTAQQAALDGYSDWTVRAKWQDQTDSSKYFTATFGHGLLFTYFEFAPGVDPRINFPDDWAVGQFDLYRLNNTKMDWNTTISTSCVTIRYRDQSSGKEIYYGLFAAPGSSFTITSSGHLVDIALPADKRYFSIGLMTSPNDLAEWRNYAYAFVNDSKVSWNVDTLQSVVSTTFTVTTDPKQGSQETTLLALFPHQWKRATNITSLPQAFKTLRGTMTVIAANSFSVSDQFHGILPCLPDKGSYDKTKLKQYLNDDKAPPLTLQDTYWHGKELCRLANLIPIAGQLGETAIKNALINRLKTNLADWYTYTPGENNKYFYYEPGWGAMVGYDTGEFHTQNFDDQHYHLGYFVYASALLSLYSPDFVSQYGGMVELLIRSYTSPDRTDAMFPFLRTFDPYEGHSWASGLALFDDGNNQESSSEAMNSWSAVYLWGLASGNTAYRDLGIWGYVTEYAAIKEYYFDTDNTQYGAGYNHNAAGILWGGKIDFATWFGLEPEYIRGIQMLPLTPSMLYLGYNTAYVQENYNQMVSENGGAENQWQDTIGKFQALYDADAASAKFSDSWSFDSANSKTAVYHWLYDFKGLGAIDTSVRADSPSFGVFDKQGTKTYVCYNPSASSSTVTFYQGNSAVGTVEAPPRSMVTTGDFSQVITDVFFDPAAQNSTSVLVDSMTDTLVYFSTAGWSVSLSLPTGTFREQVLLSISTGVVPSSLPETQQPTAIAFGIATDKDLQPLKDIALTVAYQDSAVAGCDESKLFISRYDTASAAWLPLSSIVNAAANSVSAAINHLSRFAVLQFAPASSVQRSTVYPNPYRPGSGTAFDRPGGIVFANLALRSQIKIFTLSGELVFETEENDGDGRLEWAAVNHSGEKLASGIYLYIVTGAGGEKKTGKIAIIK